MQGLIKIVISALKRMAPVSVLLVLAAFSSTLEAGSLALSGDQYYVVLGSRATLDQAVGLALYYSGVESDSGNPPFVARAVNGWFAVITGPHVLPSSSKDQFLAAKIKDGRAPKDAILSRGINYADVAWKQPESNVLDTLSFDGEHKVSMFKGDLQIKLTRRQVDNDNFGAVAVGIYKAKPAFRMEFDSEYPVNKPASELRLVRLDLNSSLPQIVFTYFWQGAHCCTMTKIASMSGSGSWHVIGGDTLDGAGYAFEDLEGRKFNYLVSYDQDFYYAFDCYACSYPPLRIQQLRGDSLEDVSSDDKFVHFYLQQLYALEETANKQHDSDLWHSNGFLAGWIATSLRARRPENWSLALQLYDHNSDSGLPTEKCTIDKPLEECPNDKKVVLAFPAALRELLVHSHYIDDQEKLPIPYEVKPTQAPEETNKEDTTGMNAAPGAEDAGTRIPGVPSTYSLPLPKAYGK
jgi:serine protease Do